MKIHLLTNFNILYFFIFTVRFQELIKNKYCCFFCKYLILYNYIKAKKPWFLIVFLFCDFNIVGFLYFNDLYQTKDFNTQLQYIKINHENLSSYIFISTISFKNYINLKKFFCIVELYFQTIYKTVRKLWQR